MKSFIVSSIRMLVWTDLKLCLPDSESLLWIWKSRCAELIVLPWMKTFEEWSTSATGNIASDVVVERDGILIPRSLRSTATHSMSKFWTNLVLNLFLLWIFLVSGLTWLTSYRIPNGAKENKSGPSPHQPHIQFTSRTCFSSCPPKLEGTLGDLTTTSKSSPNKFRGRGWQGSVWR